MKVLFLDIDGVVAVPGYAISEGLWIPNYEHVQRVNEVVHRTGCKVVLSSSWRITHGLEGTHQALKRAGASFELFDATPNHASRIGVLYLAHRRGSEVSQWLERHPEVERVAIVDDSEDFGPLVERLVRTRFSHGIQDGHVDRLVALLGGV